MNRPSVHIKIDVFPLKVVASHSHVRVSHRHAMTLGTQKISIWHGPLPKTTAMWMHRPFATVAQQQYSVFIHVVLAADVTRLARRY